jgi:hypothetical protein
MGVKFMLNTKTYSKLLRETAKQNGVELLKGQWSEGVGRTRSHPVNKVVTFKVNTTAGDFDQFITDLTVQTKLQSGNAPRFTAPRKDFESRMVPGGLGYSRERFETDYEFTYVKFYTVAA